MLQKIRIPQTLLQPGDMIAANMNLVLSVTRYDKPKETAMGLSYFELTYLSGHDGRIKIISIITNRDIDTYRRQ